jgi:hypothetical protein
VSGSPTGRMPKDILENIITITNVYIDENISSY